MSSDKLDKFGLHSVVYDLRAWLLRTESDLRHKAKQRAKVDDRDGRKECWEQAEGVAMCLAKLDDLVNQLKAATKVVKRAAPIVVDEEPDTCVDDPSVYLPTPDEIAAKTAEIRSGWTESEQQRRHWQKNDETDFEKPTNFIF